MLYKSKSYINFFVQVLAFTKKLLVCQQISITRYILTAKTRSPHQWVRAIPGQIILFKQVNIHVYSIEVKYLSLMSIDNPLHARVYWPFQGGAYFQSHNIFLSEDK